VLRSIDNEFVPFIAVTPGSASGSPHQTFCCGYINALKGNSVTPCNI